jgi:hypothetical protein
LYSFFAGDNNRQLSRAQRTLMTKLLIVDIQIQNLMITSVSVTVLTSAIHCLHLLYNEIARQAFLQTTLLSDLRRKSVWKCRYVFKLVTEGGTDLQEREIPVDNQNK